VVRVNSAEEVPDDLSGTVGVTAGASAPEELVAAVIARLDPRDGVEEVTFTAEDEYFPPPRELRDLLSAVSAAAAFALGAPPSEPVPDRDLAASDVLAALAS
jgi:4-hydroxy-3-methylbut-2-enyl diphosphate reductase